MTTATLTKTQWTAESYFALARPDDETRYEVLNGELHKMPSPTFFHQRVVTRLTRLISNFLEENPMGEVCVSPVDVVLGTTVVIPDLLFIGNDRKSIIGTRINGAPSLVVEVLSLSTARRDWTTKRALYEEHGVLEYWLINPESEKIEQLVLEDGKYTLIGEFSREDVVKSQVLVGFEMAAGDLFTTS